MLSSMVEMTALGSTEMVGRSSSAIRVNVAILIYILATTRVNEKEEKKETDRRTTIYVYS